MSEPELTPDDIDAIIAEGDERMKRLYALFLQCPVCDVYGVVHPSGTGSGGKGGVGGENEWTFMLTLNPWRRAGGACQDSELLIRKSVPEEDLRGSMDAFAAYDVVHLKLRVLEEPFMEDYPNRRDALLVEIVDTRFQDEELAKQARELATPKSYRDDYFGKLVLDRRLNWLVTKRWRGFSRYTIHIYRDGQTYDARQAWEKIQHIESHMNAICDAVVKEFCDSTWESPGTMTPRRFLRKIKLRSVTIETSGRAEVWFGDGGLFYGHDIVVRIGADNEIRGASLAG